MWSKYSTIREAAGEGTVEDVQYFIEEKGEDVNPTICASPLHEAAYYGNVEVAKFLISKGANANIKLGGGETPLHNAAMDSGKEKHDKGKVEVVKLLITNGANINAQNTLGVTPLKLAEAGRIRAPAK